jgi:hypothetical protein
MIIIYSKRQKNANSFMMEKFHWQFNPQILSLCRFVCVTRWEEYIIYSTLKIKKKYFMVFYGIDFHVLIDSL